MRTVSQLHTHRYMVLQQIQTALKLTFIAPYLIYNRKGMGQISICSCESPLSLITLEKNCGFQKLCGCINHCILQVINYHMSNTTRPAIKSRRQLLLHALVANVLSDLVSYFLLPTSSIWLSCPQAYFLPVHLSHHKTSQKQLNIQLKGILVSSSRLQQNK